MKVTDRICSFSSASDSVFLVFTSCLTSFNTFLLVCGLGWIAAAASQTQIRKVNVHDELRTYGKFSVHQLRHLRGVWPLFRERDGRRGCEDLLSRHWVVSGSEWKLWWFYYFYFFLTDVWWRPSVLCFMLLLPLPVRPGGRKTPILPQWNSSERQTRE